MSPLATHLEQITLSCQGIDSLPFPPPQIFINALLSTPDITTLIRDTEPHERALFSVPPPSPASTPANPDPPRPSRRQTVFAVAGGEVATANPTNKRRHTAVAAVLGGELHAQIRRTGEVHIETLLSGAERLCTVYPLREALARIQRLRARGEQQGNAVAYYERRVAEQQDALERMTAERGWTEEEEEEEVKKGDENSGAFTEEDLRREEEEVKELDRKKRGLQARLKSLELDLGALLNMS